MKKLYLFLASLLIVQASLFADWKEKIAERNTDAVVILNAYGVMHLSVGNVEIATMSVRGLCGATFIDKRGSLLTAAHCVSSSEEKNMFMSVRVEISSVSFRTTNGLLYDADIVNADEDVDLAVVRPHYGGNHFPYVDLGQSKDLQVGSDVLVIGHPSGLFWTVTNGIISALNRSIFFQYDAVTLPGSSGGPVFNRAGRLIGVVSRYRAGPLGSGTGLNFAVSIDTILDYLSHIVLPDERPRRYRIGDIRWN